MSMISTRSKPSITRTSRTSRLQPGASDSATQRSHQRPGLLDGDLRRAVGLRVFHVAAGKIDVVVDRALGQLGGKAGAVFRLTIAPVAGSSFTLNDRSFQASSTFGPGGTAGRSRRSDRLIPPGGKGRHVAGQEYQLARAQSL